MSMRYQAGVLTASFFPLQVPNAPTVGTATQGNSQLSLTFTAPANVGAGAITSYIVEARNSSTGAVFTGTGTSSPVVVTGLTNDQTYTARVAATNAYGTGPYSASSNSVTPINAGQQAYTTAGTYSWVCPAGITSISVVAVGGGGGGGSGLGYAGTSSDGGTGGVTGANGGAYGGGGGGANADAAHNGGTGGRGAVRIIWGSGRAFPNTNTGNL